MKFDIYVKNKFGGTVYITQFDPTSAQNNLYSTFNEKISHGDNDQITFTFSIARKITKDDGSFDINPFLKYLVFGNKLYLQTEHNLYELIIAQISPSSGRNNTIYEFSCQDEISYKWSRMKVGYSYSTVKRGGVRTIYQIANEILADCDLADTWQTQRRNVHLYPNNNLVTEKITLEVENSNPYNAIIEGLNALGASMLVDYNTHEIRFYQKDKVLFSGYRYRPETNLRSINANYDIDELATILHVIGGTDEKGMNVMLVPPMPDAVKAFLADHSDYEDGFINLIKSDENGDTLIQQYYQHKTTSTNPTDPAVIAFMQEKEDVLKFCTMADQIPSLGQFLYNFDFFVQNGLMSKEQYTNIRNIFDKEMHDINLELKPLIIDYYNLDWNLNKTLIDAEPYLEQINGAYAKLKEEENEVLIAGFIEDINKANNNIQLLFNNDFFSQYYTLYGANKRLTDGTYVPELQTIVDKVNNFIEIRKMSRYYYKQCQLKYKNEYDNFFNPDNYSIKDDDNNEDYDTDKANLEADIVYYRDRYYLALRMCGTANTFDHFMGDFVSDSVSSCYKYNYKQEYLFDTDDRLIEEEVTNTTSSEQIVDSYYARLFKCFINKLREDSNHGIYGRIQYLEQLNAGHWANLYHNYSQFIYEANYENTDELDSLSLYNQAITYFENYHHPKSSYSVEVLNLEELEQIGSPNLRVNSRIRVYNEDLGLDEGSTYFVEEINIDDVETEDTEIDTQEVDIDIQETETEETEEIGAKLNNISYTTNELLITSLEYELRKSANMSITVERIIQYQTILQKLIKNVK